MTITSFKNSYNGLPIKFGSERNATASKKNSPISLREDDDVVVIQSPSHRRTTDSQTSTTKKENSSDADSFVEVSDPENSTIPIQIKSKQPAKKAAPPKRKKGTDERETKESVAEAMRTQQFGTLRAPSPPKPSPEPSPSQRVIALSDDES